MNKKIKEKINNIKKSKNKARETENLISGI